MAWVFAYGSSMGDAVLGRYGARPARVPDHRRAFLHESRKRWGTPEHPCPILGLARGAGGASDLAAVEARLRAAHGVVGTGVEYVRTLVHAMEPHGIHAPPVDALWARLRG